MSAPQVIRLAPDAALEPCVTIDPANVISGPAEEAIRLFYESRDSAFSAGIWTSTPAKDRISDFPVDEFCVILEGEVRLTDENGVGQSFTAGDAFVVPRGFRGTWETVDAVRKLFAIFDPSKAGGSK